MRNPAASGQAAWNPVVDRALVVVQDPRAWSGLKDILGELGVSRVAHATGEELAMRHVAGGVDAVFVFASLPDRLALRVISAAASACPAPRLIVVSDGPHPDLFELARAGAQAHLSWPLCLDEVRVCLEAPMGSMAGLDAATRPLLGRVGLRDAQSLLRQAMLRNALTASQGSRRGAARILGVTRPAVQRMLREDGAPEPSDSQADEPQSPAEPAPLPEASGARQSRLMAGPRRRG